MSPSARKKWLLGVVAPIRKLIANHSCNERIHPPPAPSQHDARPRVDTSEPPNNARAASDDYDGRASSVASVAGVGDVARQRGARARWASVMRFFFFSFFLGDCQKVSVWGPPCFFFSRLFMVGVQSPCHPRDRARGAREVAASRNSDATRHSVTEYMCRCLCRVASRLPCHPTTGVASLCVTSPLAPRHRARRRRGLADFGNLLANICHRADGANAAWCCEPSISQNSDATRLRNAAYIYLHVCRVASRIPCASSPRPPSHE